MLEFIQDYLTGEQWEKLCNSCYRMRYQEDGYQEIPAAYRGDGGIEGFTKTGIVYQCYCPEKEYTDDELYAHMRAKMTKDIAKFISPDYEKILKGMGVRDVHKWQFVVPQYKDRRILEHAENKRNEVLEYRRNHLEQCDYIAEDFVIDVKVASDFKVEISRIARNDLGVKLDLTVLRNQKIDWTGCESQKVENVKRKIRAVMNNIEEDDKDYIELVNFYMESYVIGHELMEKVRTSDIELYEQIIELEQAYKRDVAVKTKSNTENSMNYQLFSEILKDFQNTLEKEFPYLSARSIGELKDDMVSSWLADCSMQFKFR